MNYSVRVKIRETGENISLFDTDNKEAADQYFNRTTVLGATYDYVQLVNNRTGVELRLCYLQN